MSHLSYLRRFSNWWGYPNSWMLWNSLWKICNGWSGAKPILGNLHTAHPQKNADKLEIMAQDWCTNCSGRRNGWRNGWSSESRPSTLGGPIIPPFPCQINRSTTWFRPVIWGGNLEPWAIPAGSPLHMTLDAENTTMSWGMSTSWTKHEQTPSWITGEWTIQPEVNGDSATYCGCKILRHLVTA